MVTKCDLGPPGFFDVSLCYRYKETCLFSKLFLERSMFSPVFLVLSVFLGFHFILHLALRLSLQFFSIPLAGPFSYHSLVKSARS